VTLGLVTSKLAGLTTTMVLMIVLVPQAQAVFARASGEGDAAAGGKP